ncbi:MAG: hypothetical protein QOH70_2084 [Blastocatellia bacterium]|jgi:hypothetical protein|nr:hypothetical protein [Blastocatellia bacterium]
MKKQAYIVIAMIVLVGSMAVAARAQTSGRTQLIANIPFQFSVGNKTLPAGEYTVLAVDADSANVALKIQSQDGKMTAMVRMMTVTGKAQESAKLTFHRYGDQYFFAEAWVDGDTSGLQAQKPRAERAITRELAGAKIATESVALTVRR